MLNLLERPERRKSKRDRSERRTESEGEPGRLIPDVTLLKTCVGFHPHLLHTYMLGIMDTPSFQMLRRYDLHNVFGFPSLQCV